MRVLLIYPEFPDTFWSFKHALKFIRKKASLPPLGLMTVAAMLPLEWDKRLIDLNVERLTDKDLARADIAFISAMTVQRESTLQVIARCKAAGLKVVGGGPLFTAEYSQFEDVDHFVLNEAELTLYPFLNDLEQGCAKRIYTSAEFADIRETPVPLWELADLKRYATMAIQYSRGCPFDCEFCNITALLGHRPRVKTAGQITRELDKLYSLGWRGVIFFVDDNLIGNKKHLKESLLPALIEWRKDKAGFVFNTEVSINIADDQELLDLMADAGVVRIGIGKVDDLFAGRNISSVHTPTNGEAYRRIEAALDTLETGFVFANVIEFDQTWGHRNDVPGFHQGLKELDAWIPRLLAGGRIRVTEIHGERNPYFGGVNPEPIRPNVDEALARTPGIVMIVAFAIVAAQQRRPPWPPAIRSSRCRKATTASGWMTRWCASSTRWAASAGRGKWSTCS